MELSQAARLGDRVGELGEMPASSSQGSVPPPNPPSSPPDTHQLQSLAGAAAQGSLRDAQRVPE